MASIAVFGGVFERRTFWVLLISKSESHNDGGSNQLVMSVHSECGAVVYFDQ